MAENKQVDMNTPPEVEQTEKKSNKERLKDITDSIENGIKELFESDKYKQYLQTMSRFHRYSVNNQMLIYMQKPDATLVAGFNKWHDQFERNVKKGEKGIKIIAPTPFKKKVEETKLDPDTKLPILDDNGNPVKEEKEIQIPMFRVVSVFDVSQTDGKPLPQLASDLSGNVQNYDSFMEAIKRSSDYPISFDPLISADGYFSLDEQKIVIREGMSEIQTVSALLHELAHSRLHNTKAKEDKLQEVEIFGEKALFSNARVDKEKLPDGLFCYDLRGSDDDPGKPVTLEESVTVNHAGCVITAKPIEFGDVDFVSLDDELNFTGNEKGIREFLCEQLPDKANLSRNTEEVQAESISYAVCAYYGIKTDDNSFGYIASWSKGKELSELKESLETINKTSCQMITDIDKNYAEILKTQEKTEKETKAEEAPEKESERILDAMYENDINYLHIQLSDGNVWDYSIYDKESLRLVDGGQIDDTGTDIEAIKNAIASEYAVKLPYGEPMDKNDAVVLLESISDKAEKDLEAMKNMPDKTITVEDMNAYGYTYDETLPLNKEMALKLFNDGADIYLLYEDDTEAMAIDESEIRNFDGIFGIEKKDWENIKDNYLKSAEMSTEDDFDMIDGIINNGDNKPTVAELEDKVKSGEAISVLDLANAIERENTEKVTVAKAEKPSLLAKLSRPLPTAEDKPKQKNKEKEI